ncbi:hypothetical protein DFH06DRAFT_1406054 [Mycena polygramma]|nr:hypothetical protein DFH06DRAFT_1406054 [Mycena polygramma]
MAPKAPRCTWNDEADAILVDKLRWAKDQGFQSESGWKPQLKKAFLLVQKLRGYSGFGWDDGLKLVTTSDDVWAALLEKKPKFKRWRKTPFPLYDDVLYLVEGIVATGAGAFHASGTLQTQSTEAITQSTQSASQSTTSISQTNPPTQEDTPATPNRSSPGPDGLNLHRDPPDDDLTPSSPVRPRTKRAASPSSASGSKKRKRNADAASEMAGAIERVALALNTVGSPEVRRSAIRLMEDDGEFSENEEVAVMRLFTKDTAVAQTYIGSRKKTSRTNFIRSILEESNNL